jgi:WD40 repeat protein
MLVAAVTKTIHIWDIAAGATMATPTGHSDGVTSVAFHPVRTMPASGSSDSTVRLWV